MPWYYIQRPTFVSNICESYTQNNLKTINLRVRKSEMKTKVWKIDRSESLNINVFETVPAVFYNM